MARKYPLQRGAADLVSLAVGLTLLAVVFAGTTASFVYGREALTREEHFKSVAYFLRGQMEEVQAAIALVNVATHPLSTQNLINETVLPTVKIEDKDEKKDPISVTITRKVTREDLPETGDGDDYYVIEMTAQWRERDLAANTRNTSGKLETLKFKTAMVSRRGL